MLLLLNLSYCTLGSIKRRGGERGLGEDKGCYSSWWGPGGLWVLVGVYVAESYDVGGEVGEDLGEGKDRVLAKGPVCVGTPNGLDCC